MPSRISSSLSTHSTRSPASESLRTGAATACAGVANSVYPGSGATRGRMIENIEPLPTRLRAFNRWSSRREMRWQIDRPRPRPCSPQSNGCW
ncbi:hypothetical protein G6F23_014198 [Rhizopus arrhizus]|nr:hypothetical protein G6F23_014198 [Rhizopus arrhizus]